MSTVGIVLLVIIAAVVALVALITLRSFHSIGPSEVGLVNKRLARRSLDEGNPVALKGEAGFQADLLMPGLRFKLWPIYAFNLEIARAPWVSTQPLIAEMRLQWWRDIVEQAVQGQTRAHEVAGPLATLIREKNLPAGVLDRHVRAEHPPESADEADLVVVDLASTPPIAQATRRAGDIWQSVFPTIMMGDDRAIRSTWINGKPTA